jgi:hypothetical protein
MSTQCGALGASVNDDPAAERGLDQLVEAEVIALFAEIDAILCAAAARMIPPRRPPAPPATGCAPCGPRSAGRPWRGSAARWGVPVRPVRALPRSPPPITSRQHRQRR